MATLKIVQYPYKSLRKTAASVTPTQLKSTNFQQFIHDIHETLAAEYPYGAGLSANQVDQLYRAFVVNVEIDNGHFFKQVFINPTLTQTSNETAVDWEGCLSFNGPTGEPDQWGLVRRATQIKVTALDETGTGFELSAQRFLARLIQHEIDHLNGILFIDKIESKILTSAELEEHMRKTAKTEQPQAG